MVPWSASAIWPCSCRLAAAGLSFRATSGLRVSDFHPDGFRFVVDSSAGPRLIPLSPPVVAAVEPWLRLRGAGTGTLFCKLGSGGVPLPRCRVTGEALRLRLAARALQAGLPGFDLEVLRRGGALWSHRDDLSASLQSFGLSDLSRGPSPADLVPSVHVPSVSAGMLAPAGPPIVSPDSLAGSSESPALVYLSGLGSVASRRTMRSHLRTVATLLFGDRVVTSADWCCLDVPAVTFLRARLVDSYRPSAANVKLQALRGVLRTAWRLGLLSTDLLHRLVAVPLARGTRLPAGRSLDPDEVSALFVSCADAGVLGARDALLLALLFGAGLRAAEALRIKPPALVLRGRSAVRVVGKGSRERNVPLPSGAVAAISAWLASLPAPGLDQLPVVRCLSSGSVQVPCPAPLTISGLSAALRRRAADAGVRRFTPHDLRRTYITQLLAADLDPLLVRRLAGHASVDTTVLYDRRPDDALVDAVARLHVPYSLVVASDRLQV